MDAAILLGFFTLAAVLDVLSCQWHRARERGAVLVGSGLAMLLEGLAWLPLWVAIQTDDFRVMIVSVLGSGVGTAIGLRRVRP